MTDLIKSINEKKLTREKAAKMKNTPMLIKNFIAKGMHTFLFGAAGSNKTTIMAYLGVKVAREHSYNVHFWSLDASPNHNAAIERYSRENGVADSFSLLADCTIQDFRESYDVALKQVEDLSTTLIVLDTFKFLTRDINNKKANQEAMHYIKSLQALGATFVSLGHTNKDGDKQSGTAEIEQDSDAVFRVDRIVDDYANLATATISKAGRVRFESNDLTYQMETNKDNFFYECLNTMEQLEESVNIKADKVKYIQMEQDKEYIDSIVEVLGKNGLSSQSEIVELLSGKMNKNTVWKYLKRYKGITWEETTVLQENNTKKYRLI